MLGDYEPSKGGDSPQRWDRNFISTLSLVTLGKMEGVRVKGIWIKAL